MNKEAYRMLKEAGLQKQFIIMLILRLPFDTLNSILTANLMQHFVLLIEQDRRDSLWSSVGLFLIFSVLLFGYNMLIWSTIAVKTGVLMQKKFRLKIFSGIMSLPSEKLQGAFGADWFTRLNNDVDKACNYLIGPVNYMHMLIAILNLLISSVIMLFINIELYVVGIVCLLPFFLLNVMVISGRISVYKAKAQAKLVEYTDWIDVAYKNQDMLAVFDGEAFVRRKIEEQSLGIRRENMKAHNRAALSSMTYTFSGMLGYLLILCRGNEIIGEELMDFSTLNKMTQYRAGMVLSVDIIYNCNNNMKGNFIGVKRINEI